MFCLELNGLQFCWIYFDVLLLSAVPLSRQLSHKSRNWARKKNQSWKPCLWQTLNKPRKENVLLAMSLQTDGWRTEGYLSVYHEQSDDVA